jgi:hypothetical protein
MAALALTIGSAAMTAESVKYAITHWVNAWNIHALTVRNPTLASGPKTSMAAGLVGGASAKTSAGVNTVLTIPQHIRAI